MSDITEGTAQTSGPVRRGGLIRPLAAAIALFSCAFASAAHADLKLCNNLSYVVDAAVGTDGRTTATRGWYRLDPGQCTVIAAGHFDGQRLLLHTRTLPVYGAAPETSAGHENLCIGVANFSISPARQCRPGQTLARFTEVQPTVAEGGDQIVYLSEEADYDEEQARLAGIQRLLLIAGYDTAPIDGIDGRKTQAALASFLSSRNLPPDVVKSVDFFEIMIKAVEAPTGKGLTWCNDTQYRVMAAIATGDGKQVTSRGWYRIEPGKCVHPDITGEPKQIFSFAEAVDSQGKAISPGGKALRWGGDTILCTRETKFEASQHDECASLGFSPTGFAAVEPALARGEQPLRFRTP